VRQPLQHHYLITRLFTYRLVPSRIGRKAACGDDTYARPALMLSLIDTPALISAALRLGRRQAKHIRLHERTTLSACAGPDSSPPAIANAPGVLAARWRGGTLPDNAYRGRTSM